MDEWVSTFLTLATSIIIAIIAAIPGIRALKAQQQQREQEIKERKEKQALDAIKLEDEITEKVLRRANIEIDELTNKINSLRMEYDSRINKLIMEYDAKILRLQEENAELRSENIILTDEVQRLSKKLGCDLDESYNQN